MTTAAEAPDFGSDPAATRESNLASVVSAAAALSFVLLAVVWLSLTDRAVVTVRLPPDPAEPARVVGYRVTVAIAEPPHEPFVPRPVERPRQVVAVAVIRDERELAPNANRGGMLAEAGGAHLRLFADRAAPARASLPDRPSTSPDWSADRLLPNPPHQIREAVSAPQFADEIHAFAGFSAGPDDRLVGFGADRLQPSDLDLWAESEPLEDSKGAPPSWVVADRTTPQLDFDDVAPLDPVTTSDALAPAAREIRVTEGRVTDRRPDTVADRTPIEQAALLLAEFVDRKAAPDRIDVAPTFLAQGETASPGQLTSDRWSLARSEFTLTDAGLARSSAIDLSDDESGRAELAETLDPGPSPTDSLARVAPLAFEPIDAVYVTALLPDWSEWDDALRENALREDSMLRTAAWSSGPEVPKTLAPTPASSRGLISLFDQYNFKLGESTVVPALFIQRLPPDISSVTYAPDRKALFLRAVLPFVVATNERITRQRERLIELAPLIQQGLPLGTDDRIFLEQIQADFRVSRLDSEELLRRMDVVPPSLALAQAAEESGWGTSRPARDDNALFGQMVFNSGGMRLREFENLRDTVEAYIRNLNTHRAYADFRQKRAQLRRAGRPLDSNILAGHIERYSERGVDYIATIRGLIASNSLRNFDDARLSDIEFLVQATAR